ncbi:hypothetical protein KC19_1G029100 [Ceratodon purpureus]|uniref:Uncharacterized protein n=1 Tax=Ceratodon purpureus TaxID=3225 RepID=A0A8T0J3F7_CERPU|nr:hypothetical protein KC19_1G028800 [Ceratodon purpureus]KAG0589556.1 hypothetical protein KC19_1G029100 [Ceratodon purpureus]
MAQPRIPCTNSLAPRPFYPPPTLQAFYPSPARSSPSHHLAALQAKRIHAQTTTLPGPLFTSCPTETQQQPIRITQSRPHSLPYSLASTQVHPTSTPSQNSVRCSQQSTANRTPPRAVPVPRGTDLRLPQSDAIHRLVFQHRPSPSSLASPIHPSREERTLHFFSSRMSENILDKTLRATHNHAMLRV